MESRFDLATAIVSWRQFQARRHRFLDEDLDELEVHLRAHMAHLRKQGWLEEDAFREAVRSLGDLEEAEVEYRKVHWSKLKHRHKLTDELRWRGSMFRNYFNVSLRALRKQPGYSFINIAGLTLGLACCMLIFQYVTFEYSFDTFNKNIDHLYRVNWTRVQNDGSPSTGVTTGWAMGPALAQEVPEVVRSARLHPEYDNAIVSNPVEPEKVFEEEAIYYADPTFLQMFSFPLVEGEPGEVLSEPGTMVLSETAAHKYFGSANPIGQVLDVSGWINGAYRIVGVFEDVPIHSHLQFEFLLPMVDLLQRSQFSDPETGWNWINFITYVQLRGDSKPFVVEQKFTDILLRNRGENFRASNIEASVVVQPLKDIHLNEELAAPKAVMGSYRAVYFFTLIGIITLLIALVNYVNLTTARAMGRAREVGIRKVVGAQRRQLITQFLCEVAFVNVLALTLAVVIATALRPYVNQMAGTNIPLSIWTSAPFWAIFLAALCTATLLAGLYPAFVLSSFRPVTVLKGKGGSLTSKAWLRRGLVVIQFATSIALLVGTTVVYRQLDFMRNLDLGVNLEEILTVSAPRVLPEGTDRTDAVGIFTQDLYRLPAVEQIATSSSVPGRGFSSQTNNIRKASADPSEEVPGGITFIDSSFVSLYGLELIAGGDLGRFNLPAPDGEPDPVLINETLMQAVGFTDPLDALGQEIYVGGTRRIVGVLKDFNWSSAHIEQESAVFFLSGSQSQISIRVSTENLPRAIAAIEQLYKVHFPGDPFRYFFVDEQFDQQYRNDQRFATFFGLFAVLAISIACLGLFGLAAFTAQERTKEIGVRKVLGASVGSLVTLLSKDFLSLVAVAFVIATPVAYYIMSRWLQDFAYRIELSWQIFLIVGIMAVGIALLTVSYQSIKAAVTDPIKTLRYE